MLYRSGISRYEPFNWLHPDYFSGDDSVMGGTPGKFEVHVRFVMRDQIKD